VLSEIKAARAIDAAIPDDFARNGVK
jgi:hypothetical protein